MRAASVAASRPVARSASGDRMSDQQVQEADCRFAWLGYKDDRLVAIELEGFHEGETIAGWQARGYRVEVVTNEQAMRRWRAAHAGPKETP
jgi:hypothetical protein